MTIALNNPLQTSNKSLMLIGGRSVSAAGLSLKTVATPDTATAPISKPKSSIYDNFSREMFKRFTPASKQASQEGQNVSDPSVLVQSLMGAIGEIKQDFGQEAATEVMAKVLMGTEGGYSK